MVFSSIEFLFYFLPVTAAVYFLLPEKWRNGWLFLGSLFFYGWGEPRYVALMLGSVAAFYGLGLALERRRSKGLLILGLALGLGLLFVFKYADFALETVNGLLGTCIPLPHLRLPIGISFYTFQLLSYLLDVWWGNAKAQRNFINFGCYVALFPQLIAGPIVRYTDIARELRARRTTLDDLRAGLQRFLTGLGKKVLLANRLGALVAVFQASGEKTVLFYWLYALAFSLQIYFDFSGYSDMAIGLGRVFGFTFRENFDYPYLSSSVQEFWRRWHMSLGGWFRDYLYIPLGGSRVSRGKWLRNVLVVWMFTGLWHGANWTFAVWGLYFAVLLLLEKAFAFPGKLPPILRHGYVCLAVLVSFVIFNAPSLWAALADLKAMAGLGGLPLSGAETVYYLRSYGITLGLAIVGCFPWVRNDVNRVPAPIRTLGMAGLLILCAAYLADGSFNPFLYFRF